jgi:hypothetical protein
MHLLIKVYALKKIYRLSSLAGGEDDNGYDGGGGKHDLHT